MALPNASDSCGQPSTELPPEIHKMINRFILSGKFFKRQPLEGDNITIGHVETGGLSAELPHRQTRSIAMLPVERHTLWLSTPFTWIHSIERQKGTERETERER